MHGRVVAPQHRRCRVSFDAARARAAMTLLALLERSLVRFEVPKQQCMSRVRGRTIRVSARQRLFLPGLVPALVLLERPLRFERLRTTVEIARKATLSRRVLELVRTSSFREFDSLCRTRRRKAWACQFASGRRSRARGVLCLLKPLSLLTLVCRLRVRRRIAFGR